MSRTPPSPKIRDLAQRLVSYEAAADNPFEDRVSAGLRVREKLRRLLSTVVGSIGFRSLLARALTLAKTEAPGLSAAEIKPDGSLGGVNDLGDQDQAAAEVILIAQLLGLLVTFIGESLMLSLVLDAWPDFSVFDILEEKRS
jgi:hypothetical protein